MKRTGTLSRATPIRPVSAKRQKKRRSAEGQAGLAYMLAVKGLPCCICGAAPPSEAHHCRSGGMQRDDMHTIPLCQPCHTGPSGYHGAKKTWEAANGPDYGYIPVTRAMLAEGDIDF